MSIMHHVHSNPSTKLVSLSVSLKKYKKNPTSTSQGGRGANDDNDDDADLSLCNIKLSSTVYTVVHEGGRTS